MTFPCLKLLNTQICEENESLFPPLPPSFFVEPSEGTYGVDKKGSVSFTCATAQLRRVPLFMGHITLDYDLNFMKQSIRASFLRTGVALASCLLGRLYNRRPSTGDYTSARHSFM